MRRLGARKPWFALLMPDITGDGLAAAALFSELRKLQLHLSHYFSEWLHLWCDADILIPSLGGGGSVTSEVP